METTSRVKPQPPRGGNTSSMMRANKQYSFKDKHVISLFKLLHKNDKLKLPEAMRPEEVGKTDDPNYCLNHRIVEHPTKSCYIFRDVLQTIIDVDVLKLYPEQKKVTVNITSIQFGRDLSLAPTGGVSIPKGRLKVVNIDPYKKKEKGLIPVPAPRGEIM